MLSGQQASQTDKPLITIVGVMGKQGRSTAYCLIKSGLFRVRGITRKTNSAEGLKMAKLGIELIDLPLRPGLQADFTKAFAGSQGVFLMTPNIIPPDNYEFELGKQLADAAVAAGVQHIVFSSLENVVSISGGRYLAPHFTDKAKIEVYIRSLPIRSSFIMMAFFYTNLAEFYTPYLADGKLIFPIYLPEDFQAPFVDPLTATGPAVLELFKHQQKYAGQSLPVIGEFISPRQIVNDFNLITGQNAVYSSAYSKQELLHHFPDMSQQPELVQEILDMTHFVVKHGYYRKQRDIEWSQNLNPERLTWKGFIKQTKWQGEKKVY
ncbi:NmrA-like family protein [Arachidicoccus rhizosphaerae]|uniref:NmrA-like family protein n=1 Tax=Arachidicoccus rhizosphaerae TaxID=551991 RepID=A0A1H3WHI3_9BACT|nr:NmrA family NAD(P)-binding protein [Arachidicoccus rhizosphaerae]SDZ86617.1 NmrA-like family protein [Arachidicoccus rhizosphaerae]